MPEINPEHFTNYKKWDDFISDSQALVRENHKILNQIAKDISGSFTIKDIKEELLKLTFKGEPLNKVNSALEGYVFFNLMFYAINGIRSSDLPVLYSNIDVGRTLDYFDRDSLEIVSYFLQIYKSSISDPFTLIFGSHIEFPKATLNEFSSSLTNNLGARRDLNKD